MTEEEGVWIESVGICCEYYLECECMTEEEEDEVDYPGHECIGNIVIEFDSDGSGECVDFSADYRCERCGRIHTYTQRFHSDSERYEWCLKK